METQVKVGSFTPSVLLALARETGGLDDLGAEIVEVPVASSPGQFRSLSEGELDMGFTSPDNVLAYRFSPSNPLGTILDVSIVAGIDRGMGLALYGRPGLRDASQLRGARLGVDVATSGFALAMYALTQSLGIARSDYELLTLGSTPNRLRALVAGECDATMLNAGNDLLAQDAGCVQLARVPRVCGPYLGSVLAVVGRENLERAGALANALALTARAILSGELDDLAARTAARLLGLSAHRATAFVERLKSADDGLTPDLEVDHVALATIIELRQRYLPELVDGVDVLTGALAPARGLISGRGVA